MAVELRVCELCTNLPSCEAAAAAEEEGKALATRHRFRQALFTLLGCCYFFCYLSLLHSWFGWLFGARVVPRIRRRRRLCVSVYATIETSHLWTYLNVFVVSKIVCDSSQTKPIQVKPNHIETQTQRKRERKEKYVWRSSEKCVCFGWIFFNWMLKIKYKIAAAVTAYNVKQ